MKIIMYLALIMFLSSSLVMPAMASCVTTKTTTVTTCKKSCYKKHVKRYYRPSCGDCYYYRDCYRDPIVFEERYADYNWDYSKRYACVGSDDPSSCSEEYCHGCE